jgi:integrase
MDDYMIRLRANAERRGKPPRWAHNVEQYRRTLLSPAFGSWPLVDLSNNPQAVADWHKAITKSAGPISANRAAEVLRGCYRHAARLNRDLPIALPTSAITFNPEVAAQTGLPFKEYPRWRAAWLAVPSPRVRAYLMVALLTGGRPGEVARLRWRDVKPRERALVISNPKMGHPITIPLSIEIVKALRMARDAAPADDPLVFGIIEPRAIGRLGMPAVGNALRHSWRTVAADLGIGEVIVRLLMGHSLRNVNEGYITRFALTGGPGLRGAQAAISKRIAAVLGLRIPCDGHRSIAAASRRSS